LFRDRSRILLFRIFFLALMEDSWGLKPYLKEKERENLVLLLIGPCVARLLLLWSYVLMGTNIRYNTCCCVIVLCAPFYRLLYVIVLCHVMSCPCQHAFLIEMSFWRLAECFTVFLIPVKISVQSTSLFIGRLRKRRSLQNDRM